MSEDTTFNALKYRRYTSVDTDVSGCLVTAGSVYWVNDAGELHRENDPAVEHSDGTKHWFRNGHRHRENGPAVEFISGAEWYRNGLRHREGGPAIEYLNGYKEWWINGEYIRHG